ncbi:MAG: hypothetical protein ACREYF_22635 [Gammaproteobacteria bacterium]
MGGKVDLVLGETEQSLRLGPQGREYICSLLTKVDQHWQIQGNGAACGLM